MPPSVAGRVRFGGRNITIGFIADSLSASVDLGRPMLDRTGLAGTFDFTLEWTRQRRDSPSLGPDVLPDSSELTFQEALKDQLGLKLEPQSGPVDIIVVDHIEHPLED